MPGNMPDFKARSLQHQTQLGAEGGLALLERGRAWHMASILQAGGSVLFPHATLSVCGHQIAAAVYACLDSGAAQVLALGVLHARTEELLKARQRIAQGGAVEAETIRGIQGPGLAGREDWQEEFSLLHFQYLWEIECKRRKIAGPELILRYPMLVGERPASLPGMKELETLVQQGAVVVATMDPVHHGIGYGDSAEQALYPERGGLAFAHARIEEGLELLRWGDYAGYQQHCTQVRSDGRDVGPVVRYLLGEQKGRILDLIADDMSAPYQQPPPTWVAGALIQMGDAA